MNMKFDELKKQIAEQWKILEGRLLESNSFNYLREKYQSMSVRRQKLIKFAVILFIALALAYLPLSYFVSSVSYWGEFKEKQNLSLDLLKMRNKIAGSAFRYSSNQMENKIERVVKKYSSDDFKIRDKKPSSSKKDSIRQMFFEIQVSHLNVKQMIRLGTELHSLPQSHLSSMTMEESQDYPMHYDVSYRLKVFTSEKDSSSFKRKPRRNRKSDSKKKRNKDKKKKRMDREDVELKSPPNAKKRQKKEGKASQSKTRDTLTLDSKGQAGEKKIKDKK